jgi:hypothetical protein
VKLKVVPLESDRKIGVTATAGSFTPGLSLAIAGSFHFLIFPRNMSASSGPVSFRCFGAPERLYGIDVPASAHGICRQPLHERAWSAVSGASLAPKSTVRFVICWTPPPLPIGPYVIVTPCVLE